jgi:large subunit ribosomal protein L6
MSKIGRKPINIQNVTLEVNGQEVKFKGKKSSGIHIFPAGLVVTVSEDKKQCTIACPKPSRDLNILWGLHRALFANEIIGADTGFEQDVVITGLGFKGAVSGSNVVFSLGYSHKINFPIPAGITIETDKTGQLLKIKGTDKELVGHVASQIKGFRETEPYKGTGIKLANEVILRKAGKTKSA